MRHQLAALLRSVAERLEPPASARDRAVAAEQGEWTPPSLRILPGRALVAGQEYPRVVGFCEPAHPSPPLLGLPSDLQPDRPLWDGPLPRIPGRPLGHGASEGDADL